MELTNYIACLPAEILEREIMPRLSPPGAAALIIAARLTTTIRPVIWILWKYIGEGWRREVTLTAGSRDPCDARVVESLGCKHVVTNPEDETYIRIVEDRYLEAFDWTADSYIMARNLAGIASWVSWGWPPLEIITVGMLKMGQIPQDEDGDSLRWLIKIWRIQRVDEWALMEYVRRGTNETVITAKIRRFFEKYFNTYPITLKSTCRWVAYNGITITKTWHYVTPAIFAQALALGYIWTVRNRLNFEHFSDDQWNKLVADFVPRIAVGGKLHATILHLSGLRLERLRGQVSIYGDSAIFDELSNESDHMARELRGILGDVRMRELAGTLDIVRIRSYIRSGAPYYALQCDPNEYMAVVRTAVWYNNAEYLREFINDNSDFAHRYQCVIYGKCIMCGQIDCVRVAQECGLQITPVALAHALKICRSDEVKAMFA
jgi:hypothetical protein